MPDNQSRSTANLAGITLLAIALFSFPLLAVFDTGKLILGVPAIVLYLFVAWAAVIGLTAWAVRKP